MRVYAVLSGVVVCDEEVDVSLLCCSLDSTILAVATLDEASNSGDENEVGICFDLSEDDIF